MLWIGVRWLHLETSMRHPLLFCLFCLTLSLAACGDDNPAVMVESDASTDTSDQGTDVDMSADTQDLPEDTSSPDADLDVQEDVPPDLTACQEDELGVTTQETPFALDSSRVLRDLVVCPGTTDWVTFSLGEGDTFAARISDVGPSLEMAVLNEQGDTLTEVTQNDQGELRAEWTATEPTRVLLRFSTTTEQSAPYSLTLALVQVEPGCNDSPEEPNESSAEGFALNPDLARQEVSAHLCEEDRDWYRFTLPAGESFSARIAFSNEVGDLDMQLIDLDTGEELDESNSTADEERVVLAPAEVERTIAFEIIGFEGATGAYTLNVARFGAPDAVAQVTGNINYQDKVVDAQGFTGEEPFLPGRYLIAQVVREADGFTVGEAITDLDGNIALDYDEHEGESYALRVQASARVPGQEDTTYAVRVIDRTPSNATYTITSESWDAGQPPANIDLRATSEDVGGAFNTVDVAVTGLLFVARFSDRSASQLTFRWQSGEEFACGSCYSRNIISLGGQLEDTDEYDDFIVLHEFGHWFVDSFSNDSSPGGSHRDRQVSPQLAYGEGLAYFFAGMVLRDPVVVDTFMDDVRVIDMEAVTQNGESRPDLFATTTGTLEGNMREEVVAAILWDAWDDDSDDEPFDQVSLGDELHMQILLEWFSGRLPVDIGPAGIDMSDWLNAASCLFPEVPLDEFSALAVDREYPWTPNDDVSCPEKASRDRPYVLHHDDKGWTLEASSHAHHAPGALVLRQGQPKNMKTSAFMCDELPCKLPIASDSSAVVVTGFVHGQGWGTSWINEEASDLLLGGQPRVTLSPQGPLRLYPSK